MTLANKIKLARIALIPFFLGFAVAGGSGCTAVALVLFIVASVTDFLDGYIARKYNQVTDFGKFVDPLADKLMVCAALLLFVEKGLMSGILVFIILAREFIITSLRTVAMGKGRVLAASWTGKVKTCTQIVCICLIFLCVILEGGNEMSAFGSTFCTIAGWVMTLITLYSGYDYMSKNWDIVAEGATKSK